MERKKRSTWPLECMHVFGDYCLSGGQKTNYYCLADDNLIGAQ